MKATDGVKIALCQMKVVLGRPDLNAAYIAGEIRKASQRGVDIIIFPEMSVTGYFIGDLYEDEAFLRDVEFCSREIREATNSGIVAVVGEPVLVPKEKGEDGNPRVLNSAVVYANGRYVGHVAKTLQPNYRVFDDDRHFYSTRKIALEAGEWPDDLLKPFPLTLKSGRKLSLGVILCEDMWHEDYPLNPAKVLAEKGAELICNLSASPWTWQKNRKRHQIVKKLLQECQVPFVYVNNTGIQNTGKNIIIFDGSSAVYGADGEIVFEVAPYTDGTHDFTLMEKMPAVPEKPKDDTKELYQAMRCSIKEFFAILPPEKRKIVLGLSGGIDSSLSAALYADVLGPENVVGINMPSKFNSDKTKDLAKKLAENLGIVYEIRPIQEIVDILASKTGVVEGTLAYENMQARIRMEILAARAQILNCLFSANWNKVEAAFGYGTLYGDMAGAMALIGDLVKREVYQLSDYLNREVFKREVIPQESITMAPTAELRNNQKDPFDYGRLEKRGYHEEMARAFTEFRRNPEWFLELYLKGQLENEMRLDAGTLKKLFPFARHFIKDLEKHWRLFYLAFFKRIQGPPIPVVSKRAFGTDLREAIMQPHFTNRYYELRAQILSKEPARVAIYGGSFNPPAMHHRQIVMELLEWFNEVIVVPCGIRDSKDSLKTASLNDRKEMARLNFADLPGVTVDVSDLETGVFTPTYALDEKFKQLYPGKEIWHVVGGDLIAGGKEGSSEIQTAWQKGGEIWKNLNFAVMVRPGFSLVNEDLPLKSEVMEIENLRGSSTLVRNLLAEGKNPGSLLKLEVYEYIQRQALYQKEVR